MRGRILAVDLDRPDLTEPRGAVEFDHSQRCCDLNLHGGVLAEVGGGIKRQAGVIGARRLRHDVDKAHFARRQCLRQHHVVAVGEDDRVGVVSQVLLGHAVRELQRAAGVERDRLAGARRDDAVERVSLALRVVAQHLGACAKAGAADHGQLLADQVDRLGVDRMAVERHIHLIACARVDAGQMVDQAVRVVLVINPGFDVDVVIARRDEAQVQQRVSG